MNAIWFSLPLRLQIAQLREDLAKEQRRAEKAEAEADSERRSSKEAGAACDDAKADAAAKARGNPECP